MPDSPFNLIPEDETVKSWYHQGLGFSCTECGQCCTGSPGYIWVSEKEIHAIAVHLNISIEKFIQKYLRKVNGRWSLLEMPKSFDCVFLKDKKCSIYPMRPQQCRTFPWWQRNLESPEAWEKAAKHCEGIRPDAPSVSYETIQKVLEDTGLHDSSSN